MNNKLAWGAVCEAQGPILIVIVISIAISNFTTFGSDRKGSDKTWPGLNVRNVLGQVGAGETLRSNDTPNVQSNSNLLVCGETRLVIPKRYLFVRHQ